MSNNEGNSWTPDERPTPPREEEGNGFAAPSEAHEATTQHQSVGAEDDSTTTREHQAAYGIDSESAGPTTWAAPATDYSGTGGPVYTTDSGGGGEAKGKKKGNLLRWLAVVVVSALVGGLVATVADGDDNFAGTPTRADTALSNPSQASAQEATPSNIRGVLNKVQQAVVTIDVKTSSGEGSGTGMIVSSDGEILTNNHVIEGATDIQVTFDNETQPRTAHLLGTDSTIDSALIKVDGVSGLPTVEFGDSTAVQVGDEVVAIGNALALTGGPSVTSGIISAKDRSITDSTSSLDNLIQTDTAINPGNSGGPLANMAGQVIGMNTAVIRGDSGEFENIGFAIAINTVEPAIKDLRAGVTNQPAYLGLNPVTLDDDIKKRFSLSPDEGAVVSQVQANSPADSAGLARFDVITQVDDTKITTSDELVNLIRKKKPGDKVKITYFRGADQKETTATLVARPTTSS